MALTFPPTIDAMTEATPDTPESQDEPKSERVIKFIGPRAGRDMIFGVHEATAIATAVSAAGLVAREAIKQVGETKRERLKQDGETTRAALAGPSIGPTSGAGEEEEPASGG